MDATRGRVNVLVCVKLDTRCPIQWTNISVLIHIHLNFSGSIISVQHKESDEVDEDQNEPPKFQVEALRENEEAGNSQQNITKADFATHRILFFFLNDLC